MTLRGNPSGSSKNTSHLQSDPLLYGHKVRTPLEVKETP